MDLLYHLEDHLMDPIQQQEVCGIRQVDIFQWKFNQQKKNNPKRKCVLSCTQYEAWPKRKTSEEQDTQHV